MLTVSTFRSLTTFDSTINDVRCCTKSCRSNSCSDISISWDHESSSDIVDTWLWALRSHVEPESRGEYCERVSMHLVGVLEKVHSAVVCTLDEDFRKGSVVIVPRQLEWSSSVVLRTFLWRVCFSCPSPTLLIVTESLTRAPLWFSTSPLSDVPETLTPLWSRVVWVMEASFLPKVSKENG